MWWTQLNEREKAEKKKCYYFQLMTRSQQINHQWFWIWRNFWRCKRWNQPALFRFFGKGWRIQCLLKQDSDQKEYYYTPFCICFMTAPFLNLNFFVKHRTCNAAYDVRANDVIHLPGEQTTGPFITILSNVIYGTARTCREHLYSFVFKFYTPKASFQWNRLS